MHLEDQVLEVTGQTSFLKVRNCLAPPGLAPWPCSRQRSHIPRAECSEPASEFHEAAYTGPGDPTLTETDVDKIGRRLDARCTGRSIERGPVQDGPTYGIIISLPVRNCGTQLPDRPCPKHLGNAKCKIPGQFRHRSSFNDSWDPHFWQEGATKPQPFWNNPSCWNEASNETRPRCPTSTPCPDSTVNSPPKHSKLATLPEPNNHGSGTVRPFGRRFSSTREGLLDFHMLP